MNSIQKILKRQTAFALFVFIYFLPPFAFWLYIFEGSDVLIIVQVVFMILFLLAYWPFAYRFINWLHRTNIRSKGYTYYNKEEED